jgi:flagellar biogenesis protein FliO
VLVHSFCRHVRPNALAKKPSRVYKLARCQAADFDKLSLGKRPRRLFSNLFCRYCERIDPLANRPMFWTTRLIALSFVAVLLTEPAGAESAAGPPEWNDGQSVYLRMAQQARSDDASTLEAEPHGEATASPAQPSEPTRQVDPAVTPAIHEAPAATPPADKTPQVAPDDRRRLAPPSGRIAVTPGAHAGHDHGTESSASQRLADFGLPAASMYRIATGLAIVIGAFLIFAWALRRSGRNAARGTLPADVVSVIGRVPLATRQFAELLRVGNKLVLVSLTPNGAQTLSEVTDPAEVDRLLGLCQQNNPHSTTKAFEQVFRQLSTDAAPSGFLGAEAMPTSFASPAGAYRTYQRDAARG